MEKLGFEKYYIQGGDLGSLIVAQMAILYPDRVLGLHTNLPFCQTSIGNIKIMIATYFPRMLLSEFENVDDFNLNLYHKAWQEENGYSRIQATKPDTIGKFFNIYFSLQEIQRNNNILLLVTIIFG